MKRKSKIIKAIKDTYEGFKSINLYRHAFHVSFLVEGINESEREKKAWRIMNKFKREMTKKSNVFIHKTNDIEE